MEKISLMKICEILSKILILPKKMSKSFDLSNFFFRKIKILVKIVQNLDLSKLFEES